MELGGGGYFDEMFIMPRLLHVLFVLYLYMLANYRIPPALVFGWTISGENIDFGVVYGGFELYHLTYLQLMKIQ